MSKYCDSTFGELIHDISYMRGYNINIFNHKIKAELEVNVDYFNDITDYHRQTFIEFEKNIVEIAHKLESAVIQYCSKHYGVSNKEDIFTNVRLATIIIENRCTEDNRIIGFVIDDEYDSEMGIGIEMINEEIHAVGTQHLVC